MTTKFALTDAGKLEYYSEGETESKRVLHQEISRNTWNVFVRCVDLNLSLSNCPDEVLQNKCKKLIDSLIFLYQWTRQDLSCDVLFFPRSLHIHIQITRVNTSHNLRKDFRISKKLKTMILITPEIFQESESWDSEIRSTIICTLSQLLIFLGTVTQLDQHMKM